MTRIHLLLVLLLGVGSVRVAAAGQCAPVWLQPSLVTAEGSAVPSDGGIVVAYDHPSNQGPVLGRNSPNGPIKDWRFVDGKRRTAPKVKTLAPGLELLQAVGTRLEDGRRNKLLTFTRTTTASPELEAPKVKAVVRTTGASGRKTFQTISVQLEAAAPADRYLIVFDQAGKVARSWGQGDGISTSVVVLRAGECMVSPDGTLPSAPGDEVRLAWVDRSGRMSLLSPGIKITEVHPTRPLGY